MRLDRSKILEERGSRLAPVLMPADSGGGPSTLPTSEATFTAAFDLIKELGRGRFGEVQLVREKELVRAGGSADDGRRQQQFALKRTGFGSAGQPDRQKVSIEAKALERLNHRNVVRHFCAWTEERHFCILMECAEHGDFAHHLAGRWEEAHANSQKFLPEDEVMGYFVQLCDGLSHVHAKRIVHRDLKPENIFVCTHGVLKIGDFGISRVLSMSVSELAQTVVGSPTYMSPDIITGSPYSYKTDVWSLGVLLYRIASNKFPFDANNLGQLAMKITQGSFPPLSPIYTPLLHHLVASMLQLDPDARSDTATLASSHIVNEHREKRRLALAEPSEAVAASASLGAEAAVAAGAGPAAQMVAAVAAASAAVSSPPSVPPTSSQAAVPKPPVTSRIPVPRGRPANAPAASPLFAVEQTAPEVWGAAMHAQTPLALGQTSTPAPAPPPPTREHSLVQPQPPPAVPTVGVGATFASRPLLPQPPPVATSPHESECSSPSFSTAGVPSNGGSSSHSGSTDRLSAINSASESSSAEPTGTTPPRQRWQDAANDVKKNLAKVKRAKAKQLGSSPLAAQPLAASAHTAAPAAEGVKAAAAAAAVPQAAAPASPPPNTSASKRREASPSKNRIRDIFATDRDATHRPAASASDADAAGGGSGTAKARRPSPAPRPPKSGGAAVSDRSDPGGDTCLSPPATGRSDPTSTSRAHPSARPRSSSNSEARSPSEAGGRSGGRSTTGGPTHARSQPNSRVASRSSSAARNGGQRGASPARKPAPSPSGGSEHRTGGASVRSADGGGASTRSARSSPSQRSTRRGGGDGLGATSVRTSCSDSPSHTTRSSISFAPDVKASPPTTSRTAPSSPLELSPRHPSPRHPPLSPHVQNGGFGVAVAAGSSHRQQATQREGADREMDRMLAAYVAEYGAMPTGIMRTIQHAEQQRGGSGGSGGGGGGGGGGGSGGRGHRRSHSDGGSSDGGGGGDFTAAAVARRLSHDGGLPTTPKYAGYSSPRADDFVERLYDAEERERVPAVTPSKPLSQRRSPRNPPPLSPVVAAQGAAPPPPTPPSRVSEAASDDAHEPPTPMPDNGGLVPPRAAFASGFHALAASLGGKPF